MGGGRNHVHLPSAPEVGDKYLIFTILLIYNLFRRAHYYEAEDEDHKEHVSMLATSQR